MRTSVFLLVACLAWTGFTQTTPSTSEICTATQTAWSSGTITSEQRVQLAQSLKAALDSTGGPIQCPLTGVKGTATLWYVDVKTQQAFTFTSPNAPAVTVTNWGTTIPVLAAVVTYPPALHDENRWNWGCTPGFAVFIDRMTYAGVPVNNPNPLTFQVGPILHEVEAVLVSDSMAGTGAALRATGGQWTQANGGLVTVTSPKGVLFVGCVDDHGSNYGLLGLLGLIAIPVCCCCCLLPLIWWCLKRRNKAVTWCCPQQPCNQQSCCQQPVVLPIYQAAGDCPYY